MIRLRAWRHRAIAELHVGAAAQRCRGLAQIDGDLLLAAGALLPQMRGGEAGGGDVAAPATPTRNGVGRTGSSPPVNVTSATVSADQPATG